MSDSSLALRLRHWQAVAWLTLGLSDRALTIWQALIDDHGLRLEWVSSRAHLLAQSDRLREALTDYDWLTRQPGCQASDWFNLGFLLEQAQRHAEACEAFRQALTLNPELDRAWFGMGLCLHRLGRHDEAIQALTRNTELQPMSPHGWVELARIHEQRQEPDEVLKIIRHLNGFEPKVAAELMRETGIGLPTGRT